jgi:hypothetical protein
VIAIEFHLAFPAISFMVFRVDIAAGGPRG